VGKVKLGVRALEHHNTQARAGVHSSEQILKTLEYGGVYDVERRKIEYNPPVFRRFLDEPYVPT
jgi:hypothetical protein